MNAANADVARMIRRAAAWRVERVAVDDGDREHWAVVVYDEAHRRVGAYAPPHFTSEDAAIEWLLRFFTDAID